MINAVIDHQAGLLSQAWLIISQVSGGNWQTQPPEWRDQAIAFRDQCRDTATLFPTGDSTMTEFGPATSEPMTWPDALEQLQQDKNVVRTGPGGCLIRHHGNLGYLNVTTMKPGTRPILSAESNGFDPVHNWLPCEDDEQATNWVTVDVA